MDRSDPATADEDVEPRHDGELDTGHPAWVRVVTLVVLALFLLATLVGALL